MVGIFVPDCVVKEEAIDEEIAFLPTEIIEIQDDDDGNNDIHVISNDNSADVNAKSNSTDKIRNDLDKALSDFFDPTMAKNGDSVLKDAVTSDEMIGELQLPLAYYSRG